LFDGKAAVYAGPSATRRRAHREDALLASVGFRDRRQGRTLQRDLDIVARRLLEEGAAVRALNLELGRTADRRSAGVKIERATGGDGHPLSIQH